MIPCLIFKQGTEDGTHFLLYCPFLKKNVDSVWLNIKTRIKETNLLDGTQICNFSSILDWDITKLCCCWGSVTKDIKQYDTVMRILMTMAWVPSLIYENQYFCHCGIIMSCMAVKFCTSKVFRP